MLFAHDLGDDRQAGLALCLEQQLEAFGLETLERVGGGARLERTAAQEGCAGCLDALCALDDLRLVLDRARTCHNIEVAGADLAARDLDDRVLGVEFAVDSLERLGHALYALDHVIRHNVTFVQTGRVAHQAENGGIFALGIVDPQPHIREMLHQSFDTFLVAVLFEYNDHFSSLLHNVIILIDRLSAAFSSEADSVHFAVYHSVRQKERAIYDKSPLLFTVLFYTVALR